jgi:hypothetical protein
MSCLLIIHLLDVFHIFLQHIVTNLQKMFDITFQLSHHLKNAHNFRNVVGKNRIGGAGHQTPGAE